MIFDAVIERFAKQAPVATIVCGLLANVLADRELDAIFRYAVKRQYEDELLFSTVVGLLHRVVTKAQPSLHAAYQTHRQKLQVSVQSLYNKLNGVEQDVPRELLRRTAERMGHVVRALGGEPPAGLGGCRVRIRDGSHLAATEHRLAELRGGPLPGQALVVLEPALGLITDIVPYEVFFELAKAVQLGDVLQRIGVPVKHTGFTRLA